MATNLQSCITPVSTIFVYDTIQKQTAANMIYQSKKGELASSLNGTLPAGVRHQTQLIFKSDYDRMQYLLGLYGRSSQGLR
jgi:hypothetical protein